jgi:hypothetical protein
LNSLLTVVLPWMLLSGCSLEPCICRSMSSIYHIWYAVGCSLINPLEPGGSPQTNSQCHVLECFCTRSVSGVVQVPWRIHGLLFAWEQSLLFVQLTTVWLHGIAFCTVWQIFHSKFLRSLGAWTLNSCYQQIGLSSRIPSPSLIQRHSIWQRTTKRNWRQNMVWNWSSGLSLSGCSKMKQLLLLKQFRNVFPPNLLNALLETINCGWWLDQGIRRWFGNGPGSNLR